MSFRSFLLTVYSLLIILFKNFWIPCTLTRQRSINLINKYFYRYEIIALVVKIVGIVPL